MTMCRIPEVGKPKCLPAVCNRSRLKSNLLGFPDFTVAPLEVSVGIVFVESGCGCSPVDEDEVESPVGGVAS